MRRILLQIGAAAILLSLLTMFMAPAQAADGPVLPKRAINITLWRFLRYWPNPNAREPKYNTWCWVPKMEFQVIGPVPGGSQWIVEFCKPNGAPWLVRNCRTDEIADGDLATVKTPEIDDVKDEKKAITTTMGTFPFRIRLKNALAGTNTVMFAGKYTLKSYAPNQAIPEYRGKHEFYVDQDWRLPIGFIWLDPTIDDTAYPLNISMWFRGTQSGTEIKAVLFKDGKQIYDEYGSSEDAELETGVSDKEHRWTLHTFHFTNVCSLVAGAQEPSGYDRWYLNKNPGTYEIKVLRDNKVARSAKFTVGADGKVVDNGIAKANKLGGIRMVLPVKILGTADGNWDRFAWKTHAFYDHPLVGFTAP